MSDLLSLVDSVRVPFWIRFIHSSRFNPDYDPNYTIYTQYSLTKFLESYSQRLNTNVEVRLKQVPSEDKLYLHVYWYRDDKQISMTKAEAIILTDQINEVASWLPEYMPVLDFIGVAQILRVSSDWIKEIFPLVTDESFKIEKNMVWFKLDQDDFDVRYRFLYSDLIKKIKQIRKKGIWMIPPSKQDVVDKWELVHVGENFYQMNQKLTLLDCSEDMYEILFNIIYKFGPSKPLGLKCPDLGQRHKIIKKLGIIPNIFNNKLVVTDIDSLKKYEYYERIMTPVLDIEDKAFVSIITDLHGAKTIMIKEPDSVYYKTSDDTYCVIIPVLYEANLKFMAEYYQSLV